MGQELLHFEGFVLDPEREELTRDGELLPLPPQPTKVLALLASNAGRTVSREEIHRHVWGEAHVDANLGLNSCIRKIRAQLGDDPNHPRFIRTLPRRGYRFVAPIKSGEARTDSSETPNSRGGGKRWAALAIASSVATLLLISWLTEGARQSVDDSLPIPRTRIVAVLPFESLSPELVQDSFAIGLTEELIARLGHVDPQRFAVLAPTTALQLGDADADPARTAAELGATHVLAGSLRGDPTRLRWTLRLTELDSGLQVAAESLDAARDDPLDTQIALADRAAGWLLTELLPSEPSSLRTSPALPSDLFEVYLRGLHELRKGTGEGYSAARDRFRAVTDEAPWDPTAWLGLAEAELWLHWFGDGDTSEQVDLARTAARRAADLNSGLGEPHALLGYASLYIDFDLEAAGESLARAVALEPGSAQARSWYAAYLSAAGKHDEALDNARLSRRLDPLSLAVRADLCWLLNYARRFAEAEAACEAALTLQPGDPWTTLGKVEALRQLGRFVDATGLIATLAAAIGAGTETERWIERAEAAPEEALDEALAWMQARLQGRPQSFHAASIAAARGQTEKALELLGNAVDNREMLLVFLDVDPRFDALREEAAFRDLVRRIHVGARPASQKH